LLPDAAPLLPDSAPLLPDAAPLLPDAAPLLPDAAPVVPDAAPVVPDAAPALPDAALPDAEVDAALPPGPPACDPPLEIDPADTAALPLDLRTFSARGGTGHYRFRLVDPESGGLVNLLTGAYLSSELVGTTEQIRLTDTQCRGEAVASVAIVAPVTVHPGGGVVATGTAFTFAVEGGSGDFLFSNFGLPGSGGVVSPSGDFQAGPRMGLDRVHVEDLRTGEQVTVVIDVRGSAGLVAAPARVALPLGSRFRPTITGGTGERVATLSGDAAHFEDGFLVGDAPGSGEIRYDDPFAGTSITVPYDVIAPLQDPQARAGDSGFFPVPAAPGDIDGDGFPDAIMGVAEADVAALNGGAVYVYRGGPAGLDPAPARVLAGTERRDEYGRAVATADFDGDGLVDLAVGAPAADVGTGDAGGVYLYRGEAGGLFSADPVQVLSSRVGSDRTGQSVAFCDFNGDGRLDLAVGAHLAEDRAAIPLATDQGAVFVWLGYPDGFTERPDQKIYGQFPDGVGGWRNQAAIRFGTWISVGDFDGDGLCDLVGSSTTYGSVAPRTADGYALLYLGMPPGPAGPGGLATRPARAWAGLSDVDADASFGRVTAMGDLDDDGFADLVVGQINHDRFPGRNENQGAVRLFRGGPIPMDTPSALLPAEVADWTLEGDAAGDNFGLFVSIADADGDGVADLVAGHWRDEAVGGTQDVGQVSLYRGNVGRLPDFIPLRSWAGRARDERLGTAALPLGDVDGDGAVDLLAHIARANEEGYEVGAPVFLPGSVPDVPDRPMTLLLNPGQASGTEVGRAVEVLGDLDGDGEPEVAVGVGNGDSALQGINAGSITLHRGAPGGPTAAPLGELRGYAGHSAFDNLGVAISRAGDFDGDGRLDFFAVARNEDRPAAFAAGYAGDAACAGAVSDGGAAFLWRGNGAQPATPAAVYFVPSRSAAAQAVLADVDINGDGRDDLVVGGDLYDPVVNGTTVVDGGWFGVLLGRPVADGAIRVLCDTVMDVAGVATSDSLGRALAPLGDLDGDGCDEFAVGAYREANSGRTGAGVVRVFRGFGGPNCPAAPQFVAFTAGAANENAGIALAGGGDLDGDGLGDLVVGAPNHVRGALTTGAAYVLPGGWIRAQAWRPFVAGQPIGDAIPFGAAGAGWRLEGDANGERFGVGLAMVPPPEGAVRWGVAIGGVVGEFDGVARSGGVRVYRARGDVPGMDPVPVAGMGGETGRVLGRFGEALAAGRFRGRAFVIVGAPEASANSLDAGAVYAFPVW
jgi:hypothetical protein